MEEVWDGGIRAPQLGLLNVSQETEPGRRLQQRASYQQNGTQSISWPCLDAAGSQCSDQPELGEALLSSCSEW